MSRTPVALSFFFVAFTLSFGAGAQTNAPSLHVGDLLPLVSGQTPTGRSLRLPDAFLGSPSAVLFSFSRKAGNDAQLWSERIAKEPPSSFTEGQIVVLESVPRLFRAFAVSAIRDGMPRPLQDRTVILFQDESLWKRRLAVSDETRSYVLALSREGRIRG